MSYWPALNRRLEGASLVEVVIEHLEPYLSRWLLIEYRQASRVAKGRLRFTNVKREDHLKALSELAPTHVESVLDLYPHDRLVILDPAASQPLTPTDLKEDTTVVVGGILGDHPPRGRTRAFLTRRAVGAKVRSLGPHQFSIDGAVYVALKIAEGTTLEEIPVKVGVTIRAGPFLVHLPYAYPLSRGRPLISKELINYLRTDVEVDEERVLRGEEPFEVTKEVG